MTLIKRNLPEAADTKAATPFKVFIPRQLDVEDARPIWDALERIDGVVLADPFALPNVSTVFPGVIYADISKGLDLHPIVAGLNEILESDPDSYEDAWVELWVPDSMEDAAEVLDVTDLTQQ